MSRFRMGLAALIVSAMVAGTVSAAETLADVQKKIADANKKIRSMSLMTVSVSDVSMEGYKQSMRSVGKYEYEKKGDRYLSYAEAKTSTNMNMGGQEMKSEGTSVSVCDGEWNYNYSDQGGQKMAMKTKVTQPVDLDDPFKSLAEDYELKLMPDEDVDGKSAYVIEARAKAKPDVPPDGSRLLQYWDKKTCVQVKMVSFDPSGKPIMTVTYSDIKINPSIPAERFKFTPPPGVQVMDMSQAGQMGQGQTPGGGE